MSDFESVQELIAAADRLIARGFQIWIKWTCPRCGDRCCADEPNTFCAHGYRHSTRENGEPCGHHYNGQRYGLMAATAIKPNTPTHGQKLD